MLDVAVRATVDFGTGDEHDFLAQFEGFRDEVSREYQQGHAELVVLEGNLDPGARMKLVLREQQQTTKVSSSR